MGIINSQQKVCINLSRYAAGRLEDDLSFLDPDLTFPRYINLILVRYLDLSDANIDKAVEDYRIRLHNDLLRGNARRMIKKDEETISLLCDSYREKLIQKHTSYEKHHSCHLYLSNEVCAMIFGRSYAYLDESELAFPNQRYYHRLSMYLKAVIEDFAMLGRAKREEIIFTPLIRDLSECIKDGKDVRMGIAGSDIRGRFTPYQICLDPDHLHHYIVGISQAGGEENLVSIRLSRFRLEFIYQTGKFLSKKRRKEIENILLDTDVRFMSGGTDEVLVRISEVGMMRYRAIRHLRPEIKKAEANGIYHFECSRFQAEVYFTQFGSDAVIVSPKDLAEKMKRKYEEAFKSYCKEI